MRCNRVVSQPEGRQEMCGQTLECFLARRYSSLLAEHLKKDPPPAPPIVRRIKDGSQAGGDSEGDDWGREEGEDDEYGHLSDEEERREEQVSVAGEGSVSQSQDYSNPLLSRDC